MRKMMNWMLAAILICSASVFTACSSNEDSPVVDNNVADKIVGMWMDQRAESGTTPNTKLPYDDIWEIYQINADGTGFYECIYHKDGMLVDMTYDRYVNGTFTYQVIGDEELLCTGDLEGDHWTVKYENGWLVDYEDAVPSYYNRCTPEEAVKTLQSGLFGAWQEVYEEGGTTPVKKEPYDKQVETYFFAPDGTGFYENSTIRTSCRWK